MFKKSHLFLAITTAILLISVGMPSASFAQQKDVNINGVPTFSSYLNSFSKIENGADLSIPERIRYFAQKQIGMPYGVGLLEQPRNEQLICRSDSTDCVLFVENTLAMAFLSEGKKITLNNDAETPQLLTEIEQLRYQDGQINGYESRLHYFSDWIYEHSLKNDIEPRFELLFQDEDLPLLDKPTFMSAKRHLYPKLKSDDEMLQKIKQREAWLGSTVAIHYIPEENLVDYQDQLQDGDIFAFVSSVKGLDVSHTAIISIEEESSNPSKRITFWHASTKNGVEQYSKSLQSYLNGMKSVTGIVVLRVKG